MVAISTPETEVPDLGIDAGIARRLAALILDESIPIEPSGRNNRVNHNGWDRELLIEYGSWLCGVLKLSPGETVPLSQGHLSRASKLNIGPSEKVFYSHMDGVADLQNELGFVSPSQYSLWTRNDFIRQGSALARGIGGRPGRMEIRVAHNNRQFPSEKQVRIRSGSLQNLHELIGYPSVKGWCEDDYIDWGIAFKRQNGLDTPITNDALNLLSSRGTGPSGRTICQRFGGIPKFNERADAENRSRIEFDAEEKEKRLRRVEQLAATDSTLEDLLSDLSDAEILRVAGQYLLIRAIAPEVSASERRSIAARSRADSVARWLAERDNQTTMARVETAAVQMDTFDDLWPMYRLQHVDLVA